MQKNLKRRQFRLLFVDALLMYAALILSYLIRHGSLPSGQGLQTHLYHFTIIFAMWIVVFYTLGMYRLEMATDNLAFVRRMAISLSIGGLLGALYFYLIPDESINPKTLLFLVVVVFGLLFWGWRYFYGAVWRGKRQRIGVGFIGMTAETLAMAKALSERPNLGYDTRFFYDENAQASGEEVPVIAYSPMIRHFVADTDADLLVIASDRELPHDLARVLFGLLELRVRYIRLPDFYELILRRVPIGAINETWFLENIDLKAKLAYEWFKRLTDVVVAVVVFAISLPLWPLIALAIKLESKGPVFFTQKRLGRFDKHFTMIKFRTMRTAGNDQSPTGVKDSRITKFGKLLRSSRLDEIPQVLNILRGDMSFVGPRPERPEIALGLAAAIPYYSQRHLVKPGITGWDQVSGEYHSPSIEDTNKKLQYDLYYLKNMSPLLDLSIFFKTIMTVAMREGR
ncbi:MAG TPA: sugar transferase [Rectinemataceae bacterium]|nr:sugar transferase [Rectinemataceae bacterium]